MTGSDDLGRCWLSLEAAVGIQPCPQPRIGRTVVLKPTSEAAMQMQNTTHGFMGGYGLWTVLGVLAAIFLVVAIAQMVRRK